MKNNKGITLLTLVIMVVVIIILAAMTIYYGVSKNIDKTSQTLSYSEIMEVSEATSQRSLMHRLNATEYEYVGKALSDEKPVIVDEKSYGNDWYELSPEQTSELSLENIKKVYLVNYLTGEVVSVDPIWYDDKEYHSSNDIQDAVGGSDSSASSDMYDSEKGVNKPILVTGMVPVKYSSGKWIVCSSEDENWYDYSADASAWANVMLLDELAVKGYTNSEVRASAIAELEGLEVTTSGSMLVWMPRYASNSAGEIVFSYLLQDCTETGFSVSNAFTSDSKELTGIWLSKYDAEYSNVGK